jgi:hypothetical protein
MTDMPRSMAAVDAQMFWMSAKVPNDQFLLFAFDGSPPGVSEAVDEMRRRAQSCPELGLRVVDDSAWRYPRWQTGGIGADQFVTHPSGWGWPECLEAVTALAGDQLDLRRMSWRANVFPEVHAIPAAATGAVVVVQIAHALGDGMRSAALAGALLGRQGTVPAVAAQRGWLLRDIEAGVVPPSAPPRPLLSINDSPRGDPVVRTLVVRRDQLSVPTVTIGALTAISDALGGYLADRGEDPSLLGAEVPMAGTGDANAHNDFRNFGVGLHVAVDRAERARLIAGELAAHRRRGEHPAMRTASAAFAATPAALLRWGTGKFDPAARTAAVSGNTVVSSVNRGAADLSFGGAPVVFTAGYPALSPMMSLTHGVHGIGEHVAVSVHADSFNVDVDDYVGRLRVAIGR